MILFRLKGEGSVTDEGVELCEVRNRPPVESAGSVTLRTTSESVKYIHEPAAGRGDHDARADDAAIRKERGNPSTDAFSVMLVDMTM